jgi:hypothetical protein
LTAGTKDKSPVGGSFIKAPLGEDKKNNGQSDDTASDSEDHSSNEKTKEVSLYNVVDCRFFLIIRILFD